MDKSAHFASAENTTVISAENTNISARTNSMYLDYAAATPASEKVLASMQPYFSELFYNPSSAYDVARKVRADYEDAKSRLARTFGAKGTDLIITGSATEANNLAFTCLNPGEKALVLETEHSSVLAVSAGYPHEFLKCKPISGLVDLDDLQSKITDNVKLVSISLVNNELGTVQPFASISEILRNVRLDRLKRGVTTPIFLHTDASQAFTLLDISISRLGVDLMTINSAKIYGPKGIGALYVSHDVRLHPLVYGGGQEMNLRSGTENVASTVGFALSTEEAKKHVSSSVKKYEKFNKIFREELDKLGDKAPIYLGQKKHQLASFLPISFPGLDAERLIYKLEMHHVYVSTGAACSASKGTKSHVLKAVGLSDAEIAGSLRITMGALNTEESIRESARIIRESVEEEYARLAR